MAGVRGGVLGGPLSVPERVGDCRIRTSGLFGKLAAVSSTRVDFPSFYFLYISCTTLEI